MVEMVNEKSSIKQLFQGMAGKEVELLQGIVTSSDPLKIRIANDDKLTIGPSITDLPRHLTDHEIEVKPPKGCCAAGLPVDGEPKKIKILNHLKEGEKVYLLSFSQGRLYYVLDRVE